MFDVPFKDIVFLGGFENFVYEFSKQSKDYILRFVHSTHRPYNQVLAELEFIDYLSKHNASVSTVITSKNNLIAERINLNEIDYFTVCVFTKAPGGYVEEADVTPAFLAHFGREVGRLHRLTKTFKPLHKRLHWYEEDLRNMAVRYFDIEDNEVLTLFDSIVDEIKLLPTSVDDYGLIHTDLHFHNMYLSNRILTFFDFDDSNYKHFISDIAIILYYRHTNRVMFDDNYTKDNYQNDVRKMLEFFLLGYKKENTLDPKWYQQLNLFMSLRSVILYIVMVAAGFKTHEDERYREYVKKAKIRALQHTMNLDLNRLLDGLM